MANPIPLEFPPRDPRRELHVRLQNAPMEHAEALLAGYEVLQGLHESGALGILSGLLGGKDRIVEQAVEAVNTPATIKALRNLAVLAQALGDIDPGVLHAVTRSLSEALGKGAQKTENPPGIFTLLNKFRSADSRRGLVFITTFLEKFGRNLDSERSKSNEQ